MQKLITKIQFFSRDDHKEAQEWEEKIINWFTIEYPDVQVVSAHPEAVIVLGGDGTILAAARDNFEAGSILFALNLGTVGFLASVRNEEDFFDGLTKFFSGDYRLNERMMLDMEVYRDEKSVFHSSALNDVVVQNPIGMVELDVQIEGYNFQTIRGSGVLVSTATGSTAYNLSAHGPILMPDIKGMIITELLDHNIPTPSLVVKYHKTIKVIVKNFRRSGLLKISDGGEPADVLAIADNQRLFPLEIGDEVLIKKSEHLVPIAELEDSYFFKSLEEKFAF